MTFELHAEMAEEMDLENCNFRKFRSPVTLTFTGSGQDHISMDNTYRTTSMPNVWFYPHAIGKYGHWSSCNVDVPRSLNSCDSFLRRKLENWAPTSCRPGLMLSSSTISFELHAKLAEETDQQNCNFWNFRSPVTLTLTLDQVEDRLMRISGRGLPTHQIMSKSEKLFVDVQMDGHDF